MNENTYLVHDDLSELSSIHTINNSEEDESDLERIVSDEEPIEEDIETNIKNYSVDELTSIFSIPLPLNKQNVKSIMEKLENETDSAKMKTFYNEVAFKLLNYVRDNEPKPMTIHPVIEGYVNPHMKQVITKMICIDSKFRKDIFHPSHDYTNDLSERVSNVMSVHLNHVEIPNTWYVFHKDKNNTSIHIQVTFSHRPGTGPPPPPPPLFFEGTIYVENGNYTCSSLAEELEKKINKYLNENNYLFDDAASIKTTNYISVSYSPYTKKCKIQIETDTVIHYIDRIKITFSDNTRDNPGEFMYRDKVLGHYLGFSNKQIYNGVQLTYHENDVNKRIIESEELMNTFGTKYIYLCMDDFLQNKTTTNIIGLETTRDNLKVPNYYNCDLKQDDYRKFKSGKNSGLTEVKARAMKSIQQDNIGKIRTKWKSVDDINVFAKIPVKYSPVYSIYDNNEDIMIIQNDTNSINHDITKRDYFGPVELNKVRVYLLDEDGKPLDLNNENWSFSLVCKQNYQG
jgi:hypothetical protein